MRNSESLSDGGRKETRVNVSPRKDLHLHVQRDPEFTEQENGGKSGDFAEATEAGIVEGTPKGNAAAIQESKRRRARAAKEAKEERASSASREAKKDSVRAAREAKKERARAPREAKKENVRAARDAKKERVRAAKQAAKAAKADAKFEEKMAAYKKINSRRARDEKMAEDSQNEDTDREDYFVDYDYPSGEASDVNN